MKLAITGREVDSGVITFSEIHFGRRLEGQNENFTLAVEAEDFANRFQATYEECVDELIRDDKITGEFHAPFINAVGYPNFEEFMKMPENQRMEMISTYFVFDILRLYVIEEASDSGVQWDIQSLDSLRLDGGMLSLTGRVVKRAAQL